MDKLGFDKGILKQYASIRKEIKDENKRIADLEKEIDAMRPEHHEVTDVVTRGKRGKKPLGTCTIHGYEDHKKLNAKRAQLRERKARKELHTVKLERMAMDVEDYIYSLPESETRRILLFFCLDGKGWQDVAEAMGEGYTAEACKQKFSRFIRVK